jgi:hypothetical protein
LGQNEKVDYLTTKVKYDVHLLLKGEKMVMSREKGDFEGNLSGFLENFREEMIA